MNVQVLFAALLISWTYRNSSNVVVNKTSSPSNSHLGRKVGEEETSKEKKETEALTNTLKFLNSAVENKPIYESLKCTVGEVEDVKTVVQILPIFACTILLNYCLAQLSTFSVGIGIGTL